MQQSNKKKRTEHQANAAVMPMGNDIWNVQTSQNLVIRVANPK